MKVPVVAAGGVGDARGFVAALALGAEGIQMGTRFLATKECQTEDSLKQAILKATDTSTELRGGGAQRWRAFREDFLKSVLADFARVGGVGEVQAQIVDMLSDRDIATEIDVRGVFGAGWVAGMITEIVSVEQVIRGLVQGAAEIAERLGKSLVSS